MPQAGQAAVCLSAWRSLENAQLFRGLHQLRAAVRVGQVDQGAGAVPRGQGLEVHDALLTTYCTSDRGVVTMVAGGK